MPATYFPFRWMVGTFQEILDSSSGNSARIKSMTDLRVLSFAGSSEAKYSSTELNLGDFSFLLLSFFFIPFLSDCLGVRVILQHLVGQLRWRATQRTQRKQKSPRGSGLAYFSEACGFIKLSGEVQMAGA